MATPATTMAPAPDPATTVSLAPSPSASAAPNNKTKFIIIIVACVGGFALLIITVLVVVPFSRRYVERRQRHRPGSSGSPQGSTRSIRSLGHQRMASGPDASVPLLTPSPDMAMADPSASASASRSGDPDIELYDPWALVSDAEAGPSRAGPSRPPPSLRHAKNRIAHPPLETLPENGLAASSSSHSHSHSHSHTHTQASTPTTIRQQRPGGSSSTISRPEPSPAPSWLHIPRPGVPLIGAFRASVSSSTSSKSRSTDTLPSMQHYPSFTAQSAQSSDAPTTFYSLSSGEPGSSRRNGTGTGTGTGSTRLGAAATEYGELQRAAKLKASGGAGLVPEVHDGAGGLASRQASLMYGVGSDGGASEAGRAPASSRAGNVPGGYPTSASGGSSVSVYTDARSRPEEDEEAEERQRDAGRWSPLATWQSYWNFGSTAQR